jgi:tetratricopeptide (TPR) repeat protein
MSLISFAASAVVAYAVALGIQHAQDHVHSSDEKLGTVTFETSCTAPAQTQFNRAVALLHSFEFPRAIDAFGATLTADPSCAIAEWGIALSRWTNPFAVGIRGPAILQQGREAVEHARKIGAKTERERAYIDAVAKLYTDANTTEQRVRVTAYRDAMAQLAATYANDMEATIFYALSLTAAASPTDTTFADQRKAGETLERLIVNHPDHPGLAHYIIHSYDAPPLASKALEAARRYAKIAPSAPHALHMPSHTFTRLGYWQESIDSNTAAGDASKRDKAVGEELHTMDYRMYAYLQTAQDRGARSMLDALPEVVSRFNPNAPGSAAPPMSGFFAMAAIPARYALERGAWADAVKLEPHPGQYPYAEALTHFARAIGAGRIGDAATARASMEALQKLHQQLADAKETYWAMQVEIQARTASAWLAFAEKRHADALTDMRAAATLEDGTEKAAITPGPLAPARELLGEMLLELKQPGDARKEFETTLKKEPNRFRAAYGAARASSQMGDHAAARRYYAQLVAICARADAPPRPELAEAKKASQ